MQSTGAVKTVLNNFLFLTALTKYEINKQLTMGTII